MPSLAWIFVNTIEVCLGPDEEGVGGDGWRGHDRARQFINGKNARFPSGSRHGRGSIANFNVQTRDICLNWRGFQ